MRKLRVWGTLALFAVLLVNPEESVRGAQSAMAAWYTGVAPALFPFFALMPMLTGPDACAFYKSIFRRIMPRLFALEPAAAPAVVIGMLSGSPGGAIALIRVAAGENLSGKSISRIALSLGGLSPAYLILGVGQGLFASPVLGVKLAAIQLALQLIMLQLSRLYRPGTKIAPQMEEFKAASWDIRHAVENILAVCGYMVIFGSLGSIVSGYIGVQGGSLVQLFLDLPSGLAAAGSLIHNPFLLGGGIGFAGMCVAMQNIDALRGCGISTKDYLCGRILHGCLFALISGLVLQEGALSDLRMDVAPDCYRMALIMAGAAFLPALILFSKNIELTKENRRQL